MSHVCMFEHVCANAWGGRRHIGLSPAGYLELQVFMSCLYGFQDLDFS